MVIITSCYGSDVREQVHHSRLLDRNMLPVHVLKTGITIASLSVGILQLLYGDKVSLSAVPSSDMWDYQKLSLMLVGAGVYMNCGPEYNRYRIPLHMIMLRKDTARLIGSLGVSTFLMIGSWSISGPCAWALRTIGGSVSLCAPIWYGLKEWLLHNYSLPSCLVDDIDFIV
jgi:hypothetical protein